MPIDNAIARGMPDLGLAGRVAYVAGQENQRRNALAAQDINSSRAAMEYNAINARTNQSNALAEQQKEQALMQAREVLSVIDDDAAYAEYATQKGWDLNKAMSQREQTKKFAMMMVAPQQAFKTEKPFLTVEDRIRIAREGRAPAKPPQPPAPSLTEVVDPADPARMLRVDGRVYTGGTLGSPGVLGISGKEPSAAAKEAKSTEATQGALDILDKMRTEYDLLDKRGAITNPDKGVFSNMGAYAGSSTMGQALGSMVGTEEQSLRKSINNAVPLLLQAIKQATGMSAQQMNSNKELDFFKQAASDPHSDIKSNLKALDNIEAMLTGANKGGSPPGPTEPKDQAEYDALPIGTTYLLNGVPHIKN